MPDAASRRAQKQHPSIGVASWSLPECAPLAAAASVRADHIALDLGPADAGERRRLRAAIGVAWRHRPFPVSSVAINLFNDCPVFTGCDAVPILDEAADLAAALDARMVFFPGFRHNLPRTGYEFDRTIAVLRWACERHPGIDIGYETALGPEACRRLVGGVDHPAFRLIFDPFNLRRAGHSIDAWIAAAAGAVAGECHIKDGEISRRAYRALGTGDLGAWTHPGGMCATLKALDPALITLEGDRPFPSLDALENDLKRLRAGLSATQEPVR